VASRRLATLLAIVVVAAVAAFAASREASVGTSADRTGGAPADGRPTDGAPRADASVSYAPKSDAPADAIPGGSLSAHEGYHGAHTLARHVGKSVDDLRRRAQAEGKREVSTFPDPEAADRAVARALYAKRGAIVSWLARSPTSLQPFEETLEAPVGTVYRKDRDRTSPGRTVVVVLEATSRFPEGFAIRTAYVSLP